MRSNLADAKNSRLPAALNVSGDDSRFVQYVNEAQRRLLTRGKWWGTYGRFAVCVDSGCLVWPRQFASIEAIAVCNTGITIRNEWFEFLEASAGIQYDSTQNTTNVSDCNSCSCGGPQLFDRGTAPGFKEISGSDKKLKVYCDLAADNGVELLIPGYDENDNWIRDTDGSGDYVEGELIAAAVGGTLSSNFFKSYGFIQKPVTEGNVRLYEFDTVASTQRLIAYFEPDETRPVYRKSLVGGLSAPPAGETITLNVIAKLEFIPAGKDTDWLMIGNLEALKLACKAIRKEEADLEGEALTYWQAAIAELQAELRHYLGSGAVRPVRCTPSYLGGASVENII